ncbi:hypothetical protein VOLCADRAFT_103022 [Volvox carteri f. nagariensis]|uniref:Protein HGH1 N-terminal domain-containing protein n=1 Tax=Volvox carteri f. nagariensis TaxID=3068 RepID=D8TJE4_VOLCA|nr:uncharacterized protein VOLCADRAFT_103022 [Volvox carteri f. nagariensis]EFJ52357.1 hypothetical protein VOLCADRAFT_103022 [Volvox carteri f. nagariensis]|eukprot:XP_002946430.1 hypothetical protein VOLCADRAFT_103022 [Volvox carteri f. nagariensis]
MTVSELEELVSFLDDSRSEVRSMSAEIVAGLTANAEGIERLKTLQRPLVIKLFRSVGMGGDAARKALVALVNLSHDPAVVELLLDLNVMNRVMEFIREGAIPHVDLLTSLLANATISERGCKDLLQIGKGSMEGLHMAVLLKKFVVGGITLCPNDPDPYEHVASVLTNVTRLREARLLLLQPGRGLLQALVSQLQSWNALRRLGASGALRNCIMSAEEDGTLDSILEDRTALTHMLRPINGQPPLEKEDTVRECMAESILVLANTDKGRDALWEAGAPEALRKGYEDEQHPGVCMAMERTAEIFLSHSTIDSGAMPGVLGMASSSAQQRRQQEQQEQQGKEQEQ